MAYSSKLSYWYVKYFIKNPVLYLLFIASGISIFLFLAFNTEVKVNSTYNGELIHDEDYLVVHLSEELSMEEIEYMYIYINKSKKVCKVVDFNFEESEIIMDVEENQEVFTLLNGLESVQVKLDIPIEKITLFHKVFIKGGKS